MQINEFENYLMKTWNSVFGMVFHSNAHQHENYLFDEIKSGISDRSFCNQLKIYVIIWL